MVYISNTPTNYTGQNATSAQPYADAAPVTTTSQPLQILAAPSVTDLTASDDRVYTTGFTGFQPVFNFNLTFPGYPTPGAMNDDAPDAEITTTPITTTAPVKAPAPAIPDLSRYEDIVEKADAFGSSLIYRGLPNTAKQYDLQLFKRGNEHFIMPAVLAEYLGISASEASIAMNALAGRVNPYDGFSATEAYEFLNFISERAASVLDSDGVAYDEASEKQYADMYVKAQEVMTALPKIGLQRFAKDNELKLYNIGGEKVLLPADVARWYGLTDAQLAAAQTATNFTAENGLNAREMYSFADYIAGQTESFADAAPDAPALPGSPPFPPAPPAWGGQPPVKGGGTPPVKGGGMPPIPGTPPTPPAGNGFEALLTSALNGLLSSLTSMGLIPAGFTFSYPGTTGGKGGAPAMPPVKGGGFPPPPPPGYGGKVGAPLPPAPPTGGFPPAPPGGFPPAPPTGGFPPAPPAGQPSNPFFSGGGVQAPPQTPTTPAPTVQADSAGLFSRYLAPAPFGGSYGAQPTNYGANPFFSR